MSDARIPDDWVVVAEAASGSEANLILGRLEQEGIEAIMLQARHAPGAWLTGAEAEWAPKTVAVPADRAEEAITILAEEGIVTGDAGFASDEGEVDGAEFDDGFGRTGMPETLAEGGSRTLMGGMRTISWAIALLVLGGFSFAYCADPTNVP